MPKATVHEHRGQKCQPNRHRPGCLRDLDLPLPLDSQFLGVYDIDPGGDLFGDDTPSISEFGISDLHQEKNNISSKQTVGDVWNNVHILVVVTYRKEHAWAS
jgi:hypothetical protein